MQRQIKIAINNVIDYSSPITNISQDIYSGTTIVDINTLIVSGYTGSYYTLIIDDEEYSDYIYIRISGDLCNDDLIYTIRVTEIPLAGLALGKSTVTAQLDNKSLRGAINNSSQVIGVLKQPVYFNNYITTLKSTTDCKLVARGDFTLYGGTSSVKLAKMSLSGEKDNTFNTNLGSSVGNTVYSHTGAWVDKFGYIYITGVFNTFNGSSANNFIKLNPDGTKNTEFVLGTAFNDYTLIPYVGESENHIFVSGKFTTWKGQATGRGIAKLDRYGNLNATFRSGVGGGAGQYYVVVEILEWDASNIIVLGYFSSWNGLYAHGVVVLNKNSGQKNYSFANGNGPSPLGYSAGYWYPTKSVIDKSNGNKLICTGRFTTWNGQSRNCIARVNRDGSLDETYVVGTGFNFTYHGYSTPYTALSGVYYDEEFGKIVLGGNFNTYNSQTVPPLVRLNNDGSLDNTFNYNLPDIGTISDITKVGDHYYAAVDVWVLSPGTNNTYLVKIDAFTGDSHFLMNLDIDKVTPCGNSSYGYSNNKTTLVGVLTRSNTLLGVLLGSSQFTGSLTDKPHLLIDGIIYGVTTTSGLIRGFSLIEGVSNSSTIILSTLYGIGDISGSSDTSSTTISELRGNMNACATSGFYFG